MNVVRWLPLGVSLLVAAPVGGRPKPSAEPAPDELSPAVSISSWRCRKGAEDVHADLDVEIALRQMPAVSDDGTLAIGVQELLADDESDHPPPPSPRVAPDIIWRSKSRVVVYFVELTRKRALSPIGLLSSPLYPEAEASCPSIRRSYEKTVREVNRRLSTHKWFQLRPLLTKLRAPHRQAADAPTTQRHTIGSADIVFRYPAFTISWASHEEKIRLPMAGYPGRNEADEPYGYLELEPRGVHTWLTDLWMEPKNGILVMRLMNAQTSDSVLGNALTYFHRLSPEQVAHLCPDCTEVAPLR
jgi:hypothetical protein